MARYSRQGSNLQPLRSGRSIQPVGMLLYFLTAVKERPCCISQGTPYSSWSNVLHVRPHIIFQPLFFSSFFSQLSIVFRIILANSTNNKSFIFFDYSNPGTKKPGRFYSTGLVQWRLLCLRWYIPRPFACIKFIHHKGHALAISLRAAKPPRM